LLFAKDNSAITVHSAEC